MYSRRLLHSQRKRLLRSRDRAATELTDVFRLSYLREALQRCVANLICAKWQGWREEEVCEDDSDVVVDEDAPRVEIPQNVLPCELLGRAVLLQNSVQDDIGVEVAARI